MSWLMWFVELDPWQAYSIIGGVTGAGVVILLRLEHLFYNH